MPNTRLIRGHMVYDYDEEQDTNDILERFQNYIKNSSNNRTSTDLINFLTHLSHELDQIHYKNTDNEFVKEQLSTILVILSKISNKYDISLKDLIEFKLNK